MAPQEVAGADAGDEGRVPRTVDVELREDLVDCCAAGEVVTVVGLVRVLDTAADPGANLPESSCDLSTLSPVAVDSGMDMQSSSSMPLSASW